MTYRTAKAAEVAPHIVTVANLERRKNSTECGAELPQEVESTTHANVAAVGQGVLASARAYCKVIFTSDGTEDHSLRDLAAFVKTDIGESDDTGPSKESVYALIWHQGSFTLAFPNGLRVQASLRTGTDAEATIQACVEEISRYARSVRSNPAVSVYRVPADASTGEQMDNWLLSLPGCKAAMEEGERIAKLKHYEARATDADGTVCTSVCFQMSSRSEALEECKRQFPADKGYHGHEVRTIREVIRQNDPGEYAELVQKAKHPEFCSFCAQNAYRQLPIPKDLASLAEDFAHEQVEAGGEIPPVVRMEMLHKAGFSEEELAAEP